MLLSGLLSKMGVYGLLRILLPLAPLGVSNYGFIIVILSIIGLIYGSIIAIQQDSIKRLIAYSSFAHMGIMAGAVLTQTQVGIQGAIFQMVAHGFNVVGLFFIAKIIFERTGSRSLNTLGGIAQKAPMLSVAFMILVLGSVALPLTNGFVGEFLMLKSLFDYNAIYGSIAGLSVIFGAVYMLRVFQKTMFGPLNDKYSSFQDLNTSELMVLIPIVIIVVVTGVFPNLILSISKPFAESLNMALK
jgi:NADH-quinone oxidoreductase subunit M